MSKSAILKSSIAKKWWMALTGLFLCLFLVGHLLGNLQLIFITGEEGKQAFNEYAYFMTHNPFIKILSYLTYFSILFHAIDGFLLTIQNKKARPVNYAYNKPERNTQLPSRYMAILGTAILVFIIMHMANFWAKMHFEEMPLHKVERTTEQEQVIDAQGTTTMYYDTSSYYLTTKGDYLSVKAFEDQEGRKASGEIRNETEFYDTRSELKVGEGYKDLHSLTLAFFGHDKENEADLPANEFAWLAVILYVLAMAVLGFHLWHGFASAFQTLGLNNEKYTPLLSGFGKAFSVLIPLGFAVIPVIIFLTK
ncbi:MAG: succinate dehydrogenase cytochrome b subunit [bacterium]|nr:succinate dehydrogenase cytochrome b subunit [bacterium]